MSCDVCGDLANSVVVTGNLRSVLLLVCPQFLLIVIILWSDEVQVCHVRFVVI